VVDAPKEPDQARARKRIDDAVSDEADPKRPHRECGALTYERVEPFWAREAVDEASRDRRWGPNGREGCGLAGLECAEGETVETVNLRNGRRCGFRREQH
jgi:hypothetical protein